MQGYFNHDYRRMLEAPPLANSWGYGADLKPNLTEDLVDVLNSLLPRSGLTFSELLEILKTQFLGQRLILAPTGNSFTGRLDDLRLRSVPDRETNSSELRTADVETLSAFIRL